MRHLLGLLVVCCVVACAHAAPPSPPVGAPARAATATATPCPLRIGAGYEIYSPIAPRPGEPARPGSWTTVAVTVTVLRDGKAIAQQAIQGDGCIDVPPGPVTLRVAGPCISPSEPIVVPASVGLDCNGPQPPAAQPPHR